ncbi:MAG: undecaprenyldiphospho-muramoylpentapeptide beta-N-acetylglucosaminyltransferase [Acidiferrobacter sp.]
MRTVLILAGGTGGHVFPGLAVARSLRAQGIHVVWVGTHRGLEAQVVPEAGFPMEWITIQGLRRGSLKDLIFLPGRLLVALWQALRIFRRHRPVVALALGGFVAGPGGIVAWLTRTPLVVHEQNAFAGLTNRWLALVADRVLCGFPDAFGSLPGATHIGNPVRAEILSVPRPEVRFAGRKPPLRLLVVGGSQGAAILNEIVPQAVALMEPSLRPSIHHQAGRAGVAATEQAYRDCGAAALVVPFIADMAADYLWADVVICRAGAMTIAELCAVGLAAILVPFPFATDDHQTANARFLVDREAALCVAQGEFSASYVAELLEGFARQPGVGALMAERSRACAMPDATDRIVAACLEVAHA